MDQIQLEEYFTKEKGTVLLQQKSDFMVAKDNIF